MLFMVYEKKKGDPFRVDDLHDHVNHMLEWLADIKWMQKEGKVISHWAVKDGHIGFTVFDVGSREELDQILEKHPMDPDLVEREVFELLTLSQAEQNILRYTPR